MAFRGQRNFPRRGRGRSYGRRRTRRGSFRYGRRSTGRRRTARRRTFRRAGYGGYRL